MTGPSARPVTKAELPSNAARLPPSPWVTLINSLLIIAIPAPRPEANLKAQSTYQECANEKHRVGAITTINDPMKVSSILLRAKTALYNRYKGVGAPLFNRMKNKEAVKAVRMVAN